MRTRVSLGQAAAFLADHYAGQAGRVAELGGGDWSRAYSFELGGRPLVARFGAYGEDFEKDRAAVRFSGPDLPVPAVLEIGRACSVYGDFLYDVAWFTFWAPWHAPLDAVGFRDIVTRHYQRTALAVPMMDDRLRCYELHIGLVHLAYCTFARRSGELQEVAQRMAGLLR